MRILLDTGVLGVLCHKDRERAVKAEARLSAIPHEAGETIDLLVPELADFELRRKLLHIGSRSSLARLDRLAADLGYLPITTAIMREAARLWAEARSHRSPTAPPQGLDGDVILAAQALSVQGTIATANRKHVEALGAPVVDMSDLLSK